MRNRRVRARHLCAPETGAPSILASLPPQLRHNRAVDLHCLTTDGLSAADPALSAWQQTRKHWTLHNTWPRRPENRICLTICPGENHDRRGEFDPGIQKLEKDGQAEFDLWSSLPSSRHICSGSPGDARLDCDRCGGRYKARPDAGALGVSDQLKLEYSLGSTETTTF